MSAASNHAEAAFGAFAAALATPELAAELEKLPRLDAELQRIHEAEERANEEQEEIRAKLAEAGGSAAARASDFLAGREGSSADAGPLQRRLEELEEISAGLAEMARDIPLQQSAVRLTIQGHIRAATPAAMDQLRQGLAEVVRDLDLLAAAAKMLTATSGVGNYLGDAMAEMILLAAGQKVAIRRAHEAPGELLALLEPHRATIEAGRGRLTRYVLPPPMEREERPPVADAAGPGSLATNLTSDFSGVAQLASTRV